MLRLRAAEPPAPATPEGWRQRLGGWSDGLWTPWRVAYAGVLAAWVLIAILRLLTLPLLLASDGGTPAMAQTSQTPAPADACPAQRTFLLTRNGTLDPSWQ